MSKSMLDLEMLAINSWLTSVRENPNIPNQFMNLFTKLEVNVEMIKALPNLALDEVVGLIRQEFVNTYFAAKRAEIATRRSTELFASNVFIESLKVVVDNMTAGAISNKATDVITPQVFLPIFPEHSPLNIIYQNILRAKDSNLLILNIRDQLLSTIVKLNYDAAIPAKDKLPQLFKYLTAAYWNIRQRQGSTESTLGNAIENFLNAKLGITLPKTLDGHEQTPAEDLQKKYSNPASFNFLAYEIEHAKEMVVHQQTILTQIRNLNNPIGESRNEKERALLNNMLNIYYSIRKMDQWGPLNKSSEFGDILERFLNARLGITLPKIFEIEKIPTLDEARKMYKTPSPPREPRP